MNTSAWAKTVVVDVRTEIDLPNPAQWEINMVVEQKKVSREEARALLLEREAKDLEAFLREYRPQGRVSINVIREEKDVCRFCGSDVEFDDDGPVCCNEARAVGI